MRPVSDQFLRVVKSSHRMRARARVVSDHQTGTEPTGTEVPIKDGDVRLDSKSAIRSTLDLTISAEFTTSTSGLVTPYGNEVFVERGIDYANGTTEWVSQGYFRIDSVDQESAPRGPLRVLASDRMAGIVDARIEAPVQYLPGQTFREAFEDLVFDVYPTATIEYDFDPDSYVFASTHITEDDRFKFLNDLVTSQGKVWFWDHRGVLVVKSPPDPASSVFEVHGGSGGVLVELSRELSREGVYNAVVATGETADDQPPARAVARDMDPDSPTYWGGPFGKVPRFYTSPFIKTDEQAGTAAVSILSQSLGLPYSVDFSMVPNPALESLDPVSVKYPGGVAFTHVIDTLTVPLVSTSPMSATTRDISARAIEVDS